MILLVTYPATLSTNYQIFEGFDDNVHSRGIYWFNAMSPCPNMLSWKHQIERFSWQLSDKQQNKRDLPVRNNSKIIALL